MNPSDTGKNYDQIAEWYQNTLPATYGVTQLERAIRFVGADKGFALDVGCGSQGRFIDIARKHGFATEGMDISQNMIALAKARSPESTFYIGDICHWELPRQYNLITAWDSTFHLPMDQQEPVTRKLCEGLTPGGLLLFTCGGGSGGEISGSFQGLNFEYSTLGVEKFLRIVHDCTCHVRHVEYDQYPENHVVIIIQKNL